MALINKVFNGKMNLDAQAYRVPTIDYIDALNITRDSRGVSKDKVVANMVGNLNVNYSISSGVPKVIGSKEDLVRNRVYYFVWNSNDHDLILYFDKSTRTIVKLIENITDTSGDDVLNFNPSWKINHIDIIYRDEGDLLIWTDGLNSPRRINVTDILTNVYTTVKTQFIEVAKRPCLSPPTCVYGSDTTKNSNSLRRTLFMFTQRWGCDNFEKTTFSTYSKIPLPIGFYGSDNDIDSTKNNFITITVQTGDEDVSTIEIAMRSNIGNAWSDFVLVASLDKEQLGIPDNTSYNFLFYNDSIYPPLDPLEVSELFDWVPPQAYGQCLPNGNVITYGGITESYDNYPTSELDVTITAANVTNNPPDTDPPALTYVIGSGAGVVVTFTVSGNVPVGTLYRIVAFINGVGGIVLGQYTSILGDTINSVATAIFGTISPLYSTSLTAPSFGVLLPLGSSIITVTVVPGSSGGGTISTEKTWLWDANYILGIVYVDEQNRDMPGVTTFANPVDSDNDFVVTTPSFSLSGAAVQTPVITSQINHLPPAGAVKYYWVRRRQTYGTFMMYETCDYQTDTDSVYLCLANIDQYKLDNNQFIYGTAPIESESRIKVMAGITGGGYDGNLWSQDYKIQGTVTRTLTGGVSPDDDRLFIKVQKPAGAIAPAYQANMLVMIYTPSINPSTLSDSVYYEWGEAYDIYDDGGIMRHRGKSQNQTASQPAITIWQEGDVYFHQRTMYNELITTPPYGSDTVNIMDANFSDFFDSAVNDNGRGQAIEVNAKRTYFPVLVRFSLEYLADTHVNNTNRFYFENLDEYDRSNGDIRKMFIEGRYMYVFQKFDIGVVPVLTQIVRDTAGNPLEANSDILLNKIAYPFKGKYGIGDVPESFAYYDYAKYGFDSNKGVAWRLSQDGITLLSTLYECNAFFVENSYAYAKILNNGYGASGQPYLGNPTIYGCFDFYTQKYVIALEEINRYDAGGNLIFHQDPYTLTFSEIRDSMEGFETFTSFHPENMVSIGTMFITFKNGQLWTHDNPIFCNFYGTQYDCYIKGVFNDFPNVIKTFESLMELSNDVWECPEIETSIVSYGAVQQQSNLISGDFDLLESKWCASFLKDSNSIGGLINGDTLKGEYIIIKLRVQNASTLVFLNLINLRVIDSPLNVK